MKLNESEFFNPLSQQSMGGNPLNSGLMKLVTGTQKGGPTSGITGASVLANQYGLTKEELSALWKAKVIANLPNDGTSINIQRLQSFQKQLNVGQSSNVQYKPTMMAPPPVPQRKVENTFENQQDEMFLESLVKQTKKPNNFGIMGL